MSIQELKQRLADVPGIDSLSMTLIGGRAVYSFNGKIAALDPMATDAEVEQAIRNTAASNATAQIPIAPAPAVGGFAASIKAMMSEAMADLEKAKADGRAEVQGAIGRLGEAKNAVKNVTSSIAKSIHGQVDDVMADLGQISNDLTGEA